MSGDKWDKTRKGRAYTAAHHQAYKQSKTEMARYDERFRPLVGRARDEALNWDTEQRQQFNIDRTTSDARLGLRRVRQAAGADASDIIRGGTLAGNVMADATTRGSQLTGWQKLKKLGNVAAHARQQQGVVDGQMMNFGNMESSLNQSKAAIDQYLSGMESQLVGQAVGMGAGMYAGGWWNSGGAGKTSVNSQDPSAALHTNPKTGQAFPLLS